MLAKLEQNEIDHKLIIAGDNTDPNFKKYTKTSKH